MRVCKLQYEAYSTAKTPARRRSPRSLTQEEVSIVHVDVGQFPGTGDISSAMASLHFVTEPLPGKVTAVTASACVLIHGPRARTEGLAAAS